MTSRENTLLPNGELNTEIEHEFLGSVVLDDVGVDNKDMTLASKAFRSAHGNLLRADRLVIEKI
jgi:hypothetical protein